MTEPTDARGVAIAPGDTVIYGFGVGRSIAMAEGVVLADVTVDEYVADASLRSASAKVSLTPSGRVRLRVVRRSYSSGEKPVVDVAPDRLVVLKQNPLTPYPSMTLPPSPLPTQDEVNRQQAENLIEAYTADLRAKMVPDRHYYEGWTLERFHAYAAKRLAELRAELRAGE